MKVLNILRTQTQHVKSAPVSRALTPRADEHLSMYSGQRYDRLISQVSCEEFGLTPLALKLPIGSGNHASETAQHVPPDLGSRRRTGRFGHQPVLPRRRQTQSKAAVCPPGNQKIKRGGNLHVSPSPIVNASRIFKQTLSVARSGLFSNVVICGTAQAGLPRQEDLSYGRRIDRVGATLHDRRPSVAGRTLEQLSWSLRVFRRYSQDDIDVINAHSVAVLPICYLLSRRLGAKLIYDTHELETETSTCTGAQRWIFKIIERCLIARCDAVFVTSQSYADWYQRQYPGMKPVLVRNISDIDASAITDLRTQLSIPSDQLLFVFTGNLGEGRNIRAILDTFASPTVNDHVVFLSGGGKFDSLVSDYRVRHSNIHRLPAVPPTEVVHYAAGCDVGLCLIEPTCLSYKLTLPNKAFEYGQAGLPFFFTDMPEIDRLLGPAFADWHVYDPARNLKEAITTLTTNAIEEARANMAKLRIPSWEEEAAVMIAAYSALVLQP